MSTSIAEANETLEYNALHVTVIDNTGGIFGIYLPTNVDTKTALTLVMNAEGFATFISDIRNVEIRRVWVDPQTHLR